MKKFYVINNKSKHKKLVWEVNMKGKKKEVRLVRGHEWAAGRATQTHGDRRHKRKKTRGARLRVALEDF